MFALMYIVQVWSIGTRFIYCVIVLLNHVLHLELHCIPLTRSCGRDMPGWTKQVVPEQDWVSLTKALFMTS